LIERPWQSEDANIVTTDSQNLSRKPRILLADDHEPILHLVREMLTPQFDVIGLAHDGMEYLDMAQRCDPEACVVDISMPRLSGIEASRLLLEKRPDARIVFLSVHDEPAYRDAAAKLGARGYVLKRSLNTELIPALRKALAFRRTPDGIKLAPR
jgi:DNA-binding NarL/FixJ family response regulator